MRTSIRSSSTRARASRPLVFAATALLCGCHAQAPEPAGRPLASPTQPAATASWALRLVGSAVLERGAEVDGTPIGGLSALAYVADQQRLIALSDVGIRSRLYTFDLTIDADNITVAPRSVTLLRDQQDQPLDVDMDPEGLGLSSRGTLWIASEGSNDSNRTAAPAIHEFTRDGRLIRSLAVPAKFQSPVPQPRTRGVVFNRGFESLALSPTGRRLFTATETALIQDRRAPDASMRAYARILEYVRRGDSFEPAREEVYPVEPPAVPDDFDTFAGENGLVELLALSDTELLALERSFVVQTGVLTRRTHQRIRLFRITLGRTSDVRDRFSLLEGDPVEPVEKELLLDFSDRGQRDPRLVVNNFEAMTFGPRLPDEDAP